MTNPSDTINLNARRARAVNDGMLVTPVEMLRETARRIEIGELQADKAVVLLLNDSVDDDGDKLFDVRFQNSGCYMHEILAILEVAKAVILREMNYV